MYVHFYVSPKLAVLAGKSKSGRVRLDVTEEQLMSLTDEQRAVLANSVGIGQEVCTSQSDWVLGSFSSEQHTGDSSWDGLLSLIDAKIAEKTIADQKAIAEKASITAATLEVLRTRKTGESDSIPIEVGFRDGVLSVGNNYLPGKVATDQRAMYRHLHKSWPYNYDNAVADSDEAKAWQAELDAENERRCNAAIEVAKLRVLDAIEAHKLKAEKAAQFTEAVAAMVRQHGSPADIGRLDDDLLPEEDALKIVRDELFKPLASRLRYDKLTRSNADHDDNCQYDENVTFDVTDAEELSAETWSALDSIRSVATDNMVVQPRVHTVICDNCDCVTKRFSALVTIDWHGRELSREYAL